MPTALPDISIRQLEYLVAIDSAPTWADAATAVGVSPSALSQGLAELERRVGIPIFERDGRRRRLRSTARPVLDHARQVIALTGDLVGWAEGVREGRTGRVAVGMIDVAAVVHFPDVLRRFRRELSDVELTLRVAPSAGLLEQVVSGRLDLAVCVAPSTVPPGVSIEELLTEPLVVYAPPGVRPGAPSTWGPWVLFPIGSHTRHAVDEALRSIGAPTELAAESHQPDVLREMVGLGFGWTVLPPSQGPAAGSGGEEVRELLQRSLVLARRAETVSDPAVGELAERLITASRAGIA